MPTQPAMSDRPGATVLAYHEILPLGMPANADEGCIPLDRFLEHLDALENAGFRIVSLAHAFDTAVTGVSVKASGPRPAVAITFDDGYAHLHRLLPPIIDRIRPTLFVIQDCLGKSNLDWNPRAPVILRHLTLEELSDLAELGVDVQTHGPDHHNLIKFERDELRARFAANSDWFRLAFQIPPRFVAYPYGACNELVQEVASEFFDGAFSVNHGGWSGPAARFAMNRISVPSYFTGDDLVEVIQTSPRARWAEVENRAPWRRLD